MEAAIGRQRLTVHAQRRPDRTIGRHLPAHHRRHRSIAIRIVRQAFQLEHRSRYRHSLDRIAPRSRIHKRHGRFSARCFLRKSFLIHITHHRTDLHPLIHSSHPIALSLASRAPTTTSRRTAFPAHAPFTHPIRIRLGNHRRKPAADQGPAIAQAAHLHHCNAVVHQRNQHLCRHHILRKSLTIHIPHTCPQLLALVAIDHPIAHSLRSTDLTPIDTIR